MTKILVYGAGAIGSYVGARLSPECRVGLVARPEHARAINAKGLTIVGSKTECVKELVAYTELDEVDFSPDWILLTVKAFHTQSAAKAISDWIRRKQVASASVLVSLQNGLGNEELLAERLALVMGGVINQGVVFAAPGEIRHAGEATTFLGPYQGVSLAQAEELAALFRHAGIKTEATEQIGLEIWRKAMVNAAVNPLSALLRKRSGELLDKGPIERTMRQILDESVGIAAAFGVELDASELFATCRQILEASSKNKTSMLQDLERGSPTEIEFMNGELERRARHKGVPADANRVLAELIRAAESQPEAGRDLV